LTELLDASRTRTGPDCRPNADGDVPTYSDRWFGATGRELKKNDHQVHLAVIELLRS